MLTDNVNDGIRICLTVIKMCNEQDEQDALKVKSLTWTTLIVDFIMFVLGIFIVSEIIFSYQTH